MLPGSLFGQFIPNGERDMLREFLKPTDKPKFNLLIESISCLNHTFHCCSGKIESKSFGAEKVLEDHLV